MSQFFRICNPQAPKGGFAIRKLLVSIAVCETLSACFRRCKVMTRKPKSQEESEK